MLVDQLRRPANQHGAYRINVNRELTRSGTILMYPIKRQPARGRCYGAARPMFPCILYR